MRANSASAADGAASTTYAALPLTEQHATKSRRSNRRLMRSSGRTLTLLLELRGTLSLLLELRGTLSLLFELRRCFGGSSSFFLLHSSRAREV